MLLVKARAVIADIAAEAALARLGIEEVPMGRFLRRVGHRDLHDPGGRVVFPRRGGLRGRVRLGQTQGDEHGAHDPQQRREKGERAPASPERASLSRSGLQSSTSMSSPSSCGRKRGQTFSETVITEAASRVPISTASGMLLP